MATVIIIDIGFYILFLNLLKPVFRCEHIAVILFCLLHGTVIGLFVSSFIPADYELDKVDKIEINVEYHSNRNDILLYNCEDECIEFKEDYIFVKNSKYKNPTLEASIYKMKDNIWSYFSLKRHHTTYILYSNYK